MKLNNSSTIASAASMFDRLSSALSTIETCKTVAASTGEFPDTLEYLIKAENRLKEATCAFTQELNSQNILE